MSLLDGWRSKRARDLHRPDSGKLAERLLAQRHMARVATPPREISTATWPLRHAAAPACRSS